MSDRGGQQTEGSFFCVRRAVKAENNIYNRNDIVYDKCGFLCMYGKEKRKKEFKQ